MLLLLLLNNDILQKISLSLNILTKVKVINLNKLFKIHLRKCIFQYQCYTTRLEVLISGFVFTEKIHTRQKITYSQNSICIYKNEKEKICLHIRQCIAYLHLSMYVESADIQTTSTHLGLYRVNKLMFGIKICNKYLATVYR